MSTNRPFLANFLAAFRAQSTYKAATVTSQSTNTVPSAQSITQSARAIATKATTTNHSHHNHHASPATARQPSSSPAATPHQYHHTTDPATSASSTPIPINPGAVPGPDRRRRGSDSSSGSGGFCDALGAEKWYIGGRTPAGEERFYRLGMVTNGGGRLGGGGRVGSIDQLSL